MTGLQSFITQRLSTPVAHHQVLARVPTFKCRTLLCTALYCVMSPQAYGINNGQQSRGFGLPALGLATSPLPAAQLLSRTIMVRDPDGSPATDALRVNGAAVRPVCS
jgi:hypothetical protein